MSSCESQIIKKMLREYIYGRREYYREIRGLLEKKWITRNLSYYPQRDFEKLMDNK